MEEIEEFTRSWQILGNHIIVWFLAFLIFGAIVSFASRFQSWLVTLFSRRSEGRLDLMIQALQSLTGSTKQFFIVIIAIYFASLILVLPASAAALVRAAVIIGSLAQIGIWAGILVGLWIENGLLDRNNPDPARTSAAQVIRIIGLTVIWSAVLLLTLSNFGVDITALIAGLGVGGIAIAFALQSVLKDLFASLSILLDKPFVVGDLITFDEYIGTVEMIGLRMTRLRALSGEQLNVSNDALLSTRLRNFKRMSERRILFSIHAQYGPSPDILALFPGYIEETITAIEGARFDRAHLAEFNELGVRFEIVYFVLSREYIDYMNIQQEILLSAAKWFEEHNVRFAIPTRRMINVDETSDASVYAALHQTHKS